MLHQNSEQDYQSKIELYAKALLEKVVHIFGENMSRFMGIPLQLRLLAEGFQREVIEFSKSQRHEVPSFEALNVLDIYEHFIEAKYDVYFKEKIRLDSSSQYIKNNLTECFNKDHQCLAFSVLFPEVEQTDIVQMFDKHKLPEPERVNGLKSLGIIQSVGNAKNVYFIHKTFAEYFAATLFTGSLKKNISNPSKYESIKRFLLQEMFKDSNEVIRNFIDRILAKDSPIYSATLDQNLSTINDLLYKKNLDVTIVDRLGRTALHLAVQEGSIYIVRVLLAAGFNGLQSDIFGKTSLHYAFSYGGSEISEYILNYYADIDINDNIFRTPLQIDTEIGDSIFNKAEYAQSQLVNFVNKQDIDGKTALYYAGELEEWYLGCILLLNGAYINALNEEKQKELLIYAAEGTGPAYSKYYHKLWPVVGLLSMKVHDAVHNYSKYPRLLSWFLEFGHIKVVDALLGAIADNEKRKRIFNNEYYLDCVNDIYELSDRDHLQAIKYLQGNGALKNYHNIYCTLKSATSKGHIETFKYLENGEKKELFHVYIGVAIEKNRLKIVKYLWQNYREFTTTDCGITALHYAADKGNIKSIEYLCDNEADVNFAAEDGRTPLHYAAKEKRLDVIKYLVSKGANVNISDENGMTVLDYALEPLSYYYVSFQRNELDAAKYLITECNANFGRRTRINIATARKIVQKTYKDVNIADQNGEILLHTAVKSGKALFVKFLLKQGANVNVRNKDGRTPLNLALEQRFTDIARLLLQYGAMYDARDKKGKTPLDSFKKKFDQSKSIQIDELLKMIDSLFHSKNLIQDLEDKWLIERNDDARNPLLSTEKWLTERDNGRRWDSDVSDARNPMVFILNARNAQGRTLLHVGADQNDFEAIKCLFEFNQDYLSIRDLYHHAKDFHSMDLTAKDSRGDTPLHLAALHGNKEIVDLFLKEGADISVKNNEGDIPENLARNNNHNDVVKLLQSTGDLFIAIEENNILKVENLISKEANINQLYRDGKSLLQFAATENREEIVKILLKNGATFTAEDIQNEAPINLEERQLGRSINVFYAINISFYYVQRNNPELVIDYLKKIKLCNVDYLSTLINTCDYQGNTLLHYAVQEDYFDVIQFLLQNKAAYDVSNKQNKTPASLAHHQDIINLLDFIHLLFSNESSMKLSYSLKDIEKDPETLRIITNVRNSYGLTILDQNSNSYTLKFLVRNGAEINAVSKYGRTPLHFVARKGKLELVKWLIEHGANTNAKDDHGNTVLHEAVSSRQLDLITWLVEKQGVNIDTKNNYGETMDSIEPSIKCRLSAEQKSESISLLASSASDLSCIPGPSSMPVRLRKLPIWRCSD
ncbi:serine/threonine-protein phosphatase 6 regulatory ankyrin repeat subunit A-like [Malaya genurostris]|uniref:serine/threonine-protein phosphatase 6 regulatory ankyrin repeat subunit A-like n=1 Tax=Malaya genurostris TaxID=325434 RepID=UPI0026F3B26E|nr:serine/threonine-protein phosphatase 6 regulatory ankyrin repeat subunit A-like [Malaya genurostris]